MRANNSMGSMFGSVMLPHGRLIDVRVTAEELHDLARLVDQRAEEEREGGNHDTADRLADRAAVLRSAGR